MEKIALLLQERIKDFIGCTVETSIDSVIVMRESDIVTPILAEIIFEFAKKQHLNAYISVSFSGHLRFVLYKN